MTIPLFKSHYSIGKSILTLEDPADFPDPDRSDSILQIASDNSLKEVVLVEDSMGGFLEAYKKFESLGIQLIFGLRLSLCDEYVEGSTPESFHKVIIFMRNGAGYKNLIKIYTEAFSENDGCIPISSFRKLWNPKNLKLAVPFYDGFLHVNLTTFSGCVADLREFSPVFFIESNDLPIDKILKEKVISYCQKNKVKTQEAKSIFYKNDSDLDSFVTYKLICSREFSGGRAPSLEVPNFDHLGSNKFSWESYLKSNEST